MFQTGDLNLFRIAACGIFNAIGFVAFIYGKRNTLWRTMIIGITLMVFPYFLSDILAIFLIGTVLSAALYVWRE